MESDSPFFSPSTGDPKNTTQVLLAFPQQFCHNSLCVPFLPSHKGFPRCPQQDTQVGDMGDTPAPSPSMTEPLGLSDHLA